MEHETMFDSLEGAPLHPLLERKRIKKQYEISGPIMHIESVIIRDTLAINNNATPHKQIFTFHYANIIHQRRKPLLLATCSSADINT